MYQPSRASAARSWGRARRAHAGGVRARSRSVRRPSSQTRRTRPDRAGRARARSPRRPPRASPTPRGAATARRSEGQELSLPAGRAVRGRARRRATGSRSIGVEGERRGVRFPRPISLDRCYRIIDARFGSTPLGAVPAPGRFGDPALAFAVLEFFVRSSPSLRRRRVLSSLTHARARAGSELARSRRRIALRCTGR